jgi:dihydrofolate synthase/folylpolyglutamate synthase
VDRNGVLSWLFAQETMGIKLGLGNITRLLNHLGDPHRRFRSAHVAGTNGKGSVTAMTAEVLQEAGYVTGLYTSPHLVDFRERIRVNGRCITEGAMLRLAEEVREFAERSSAPEERLTFFDLTTAIAFAHFADEGIEVAAVEVGMGGRLDATNVLVPDACAITKIGLEHTAYLGNTIEAIAGEKAGIIKDGVPVVSIEQDDRALLVFREMAAQRGAPLKVVGRDVSFQIVSSTMDGTEVWVEELGSVVQLPLLGRYQGENCALACGLLTELMRRGLYIPDEAVFGGMSKVQWPGRMEIVSRCPTVMLDVTHTPDGAREVSSEVSRLLGDQIILVLGVLNDKDLHCIARWFGPLARAAVATAPATRRAFSPSVVAEALRPHCPAVEVVDGVPAAVDRAASLASADNAVLVTGSLYTVGEAYRWLDERQARDRDP